MRITRLLALTFALSLSAILLRLLYRARDRIRMYALSRSPQSGRVAPVAHTGLSSPTASEHHEAHLKLALRAARMIIWAYDRRTGIVTVELDTEVFGIRALPAQITVRGALALVKKEDRAALWNRAVAALESGEPFIQQLRLKLGTFGECLWMENHATFVRGADDRPAGLMGTLIDFTAHKRATDALLENDSRKDIFLATLAHELRNPLASVRAAAHSLGNAQLDLDQRHACVEVIRRQSLHLTRLVDDLLDVGRITHNRLVLERIRLDIRGCVREAIEMVQHLADAAHHTLTVVALTELTYVYADRVRIIQVLSNLLTNAIKYTPPRGNIDVITRREGPQLVIRVCDTGIGIPIDQQTRVFEPFYQVVSSVPQSLGGLGIGLALARRIVELHGGTMEVTSAGTGKGCEFSIRLPLLNAIAGDDATIAGSATLPSDRSLRILLADDNPDVAEPMAIALRMCGHAVKVAADGVEALAIADDFRPDVAILDLEMPRMAGAELAHTLRQRPWARAITLVALTGWSSGDLNGRLDLTPFDSHLLKPAEIDKIAELVKSAAQRGSNGERRYS